MCSLNRSWVLMPLLIVLMLGCETTSIGVWDHGGDADHDRSGDTDGDHGRDGDVESTDTDLADSDEWDTEDPADGDAERPNCTVSGCKDRYRCHAPSGYCEPAEDHCFNIYHCPGIYECDIESGYCTNEYGGVLDGWCHNQHPVACDHLRGSCPDGQACLYFTNDQVAIESACAIWGRIPGAGSKPNWMAPLDGALTRDDPPEGYTMVRLKDENAVYRWLRSCTNDLRECRYAPDDERESCCDWSGFFMPYGYLLEIHDEYNKVCNGRSSNPFKIYPNEPAH